MEIEQLDNTRILIALGEKELADQAVSVETLDLHDPHTCQFLKEVLRRTSNATGISLSDKKVLIEAMPCDKGCLLLLTLSEPCRQRRTYHSRRDGYCISYCFHDAENLLRCLQTLCQLCEKHPHSTVYHWQKKYYLVLSSSLPLTRRHRRILQEFADSHRCGRLFHFFLKEHAQSLQNNNAIQTIGHLLVSHS